MAHKQASATYDDEEDNMMAMMMMRLMIAKRGIMMVVIIPVTDRWVKKQATTSYGSVSAGREKWPFNVLFFKSRASV